MNRFDVVLFEDEDRPSHYQVIEWNSDNTYSVLERCNTRLEAESLLSAYALIHAFADAV